MIQKFLPITPAIIQSIVRMTMMGDLSPKMKPFEMKC
jgi:hypothetical protein